MSTCCFMKSKNFVADNQDMFDVHSQENYFINTYVTSNH